MTKEQITLVGIGATFLIGVLNFIYSIGNNRKTRFINTVTSSRVKWIGELRKIISQYISLIPLNETGYLKLFEKKKEFIESFNKSNMIIDLMLNKKDEFDNILIDNLANINKNVMEIMKCIDLLKFNDLKEFQDFGVESKHSVKVRLINELSIDTQVLFKSYIISKIPKDDRELDGMEANELIMKTEYEGWGIKKDAYLICINEISKKISGEVNNLVNNSKELLKKEWDRVKIESQVGRYNMDNDEWNINVGFSKLNKIFKIIILTMFLMIVILSILA